MRRVHLTHLLSPCLLDFGVSKTPRSRPGSLGAYALTSNRGAAASRVAPSRNFPVVIMRHVTPKPAKLPQPNQAILNVPNDNQHQLLPIWRAIEPPPHTMLPQRSMMRFSQRFASQIRSPAVRTPLQRRFASSETTVFKGAEDNAFNRERAAVKEHAVGTTGA